MSIIYIHTSLIEACSHALARLLLSVHICIIVRLQFNKINIAIINSVFTVLVGSYNNSFFDTEQ